MIKYLLMMFCLCGCLMVVPAQIPPMDCAVVVSGNNWSFLLPSDYFLMLSVDVPKTVRTYVNHDDTTLVLFSKEPFRGSLDEFVKHRMNVPIEIKLSTAGESNDVRYVQTRGRTKDVWLSSYNLVKNGYGYSFICESIHYEDLYWDCSQMFDTLRVE